MKKLIPILVFWLSATAYAQNSATTAQCKSPTGTKIPIACDVSGTIGAASASTNATFADQNFVTALTLNNTYQLMVDLPDATKLVIIDNQTNGDVQVSMTAGVSDTFHIKAGDTLSLPLANLGLVTTAIIHVKDGTTVATSGSIYVYSVK